MEKIFDFDTINELEDYLLQQTNVDDLRQTLLEEFIKYAHYKNAEHWLIYF